MRREEKSRRKEKENGDGSGREKGRRSKKTRRLTLVIGRGALVLVWWYPTILIKPPNTFSGAKQEKREKGEGRRKPWDILLVKRIVERTVRIVHPVEGLRDEVVLRFVLVPVHCSTYGHQQTHQQHFCGTMPQVIEGVTLSKVESEGTIDGLVITDSNFICMLFRNYFLFGMGLLKKGG